MILLVLKKTIATSCRESNVIAMEGRCCQYYSQTSRTKQKQTVVATSLSVAAFPIGIFPRANFLNFLFLKKFLTIGVSTKVGATVLTLIFFFS